MPFYFMSFLIHSSGYFKIFYSPFHCKWFAAFLFIFTTFTFCSQFQFSSAQSLSPGENFVQECCTSRPPFAVSSVRPLSSSGTAGFISFLFNTFFCNCSFTSIVSPVSKLLWYLLGLPVTPSLTLN